MVTDVDLTQLWYELKIDLIGYKGTNINIDALVAVMDDMEARLKGGKDYE